MGVNIRPVHRRVTACGPTGALAHERGVIDAADEDLAGTRERPGILGMATQAKI